MSVVTTMVVVPNRIEAVVRLLRRLRREDDATLRRLLSPPTLPAGANVPGPVIDESKRLGLIEAAADGKWSLTKRAKNEQDIRSVIASVLLSPETAPEAGQQRVGPAVAWFLTRSVQVPLKIGDNWRPLVEDDCSAVEDAFDLTNQDRCRQFAYWAVYLGFGWRLATGTRDSQAREMLVPDPSVALESALRTALHPGEALPVSEALARVADACPVLEGGSVRDEVELQLVAERQRPDGELSQSTSFALRRLEARGIIEMPPPPSDARVMTLDLWPEPRRVSQLRLCEGPS